MLAVLVLVPVLVLVLDGQRVCWGGRVFLIKGSRSHVDGPSRRLGGRALMSKLTGAGPPGRHAGGGEVRVRECQGCERVARVLLCETGAKVLLCDDSVQRWATLRCCTEAHAGLELGGQHGLHARVRRGGCQCWARLGCARTRAVPRSAALDGGLARPDALVRCMAAVQGCQRHPSQNGEKVWDFGRRGG